MTPCPEDCLVIVGHGTSLNENSTKALQDQARLIHEGDYGFAEVIDACMEEAPFVAEARHVAKAVFEKKQASAETAA